MALKKYQSDLLTVHPIRLGRYNAAVAANTEPEGEIDSVVRVKVSKSNREFGIRPRSVGLTRTIEAEDGEETRIVTLRSKLPILTKDVFDGETMSIGTEVTVNEVVWTIASKNAEDY